MDHATTQPHLLSLLPFVLLLSLMALAPIIIPKWWHKNYPWVAVALAAIVISYYYFALKATDALLHAADEYLGFIALVGSLFVVSGGIHIRVKGTGTPFGNTLFLAVGAILANILGTTGASMLLIRPWINFNRHRIAPHHIAFFIFIVSNVGGCMTPVGDPPLFLGYLAGVPFWWVAIHGWHIWLTAMGLLLATFFVLDALHPGRKQKPADQPPDVGNWHAEGLPNVFFLAVIFGAAFVQKPHYLREALMFGAAILSWLTTPKSTHQANEFHFAPIKEVVILFIGIFGTMMPVLQWLAAHAAELKNPQPAVFYFGSGVLSAVLDNAPTYLGFLSVLQGSAGTTEMSLLLEQHPREMLAVSVACVFFGAATYIGNGPNFMVKAIAEDQRAPTSSFPGFVLRFTLPFLLPTLLIVWLLFFR